MWNRWFMHRRTTLTGVTLVEVMVALAIGVVFAGLTFSIYRLTTRTITSQAEWHQKAGPAAGAMDRILRDLVCTVADTARTRSGFAVIPDGTQNSSLHLYTAAADPQSKDLAQHRVYRVRYSLARGADAGGRLVREVALAAEAGLAPEPVEEQLDGRYSGFRVQVFDGDAWNDRWSGDSVPLAARVRLVLGPPHEDVVAETLIPTGHVLGRNK